jgi:alpha-ketoglutaric semialdehyde dehydrogenase
MSTVESRSPQNPEDVVVRFAETEPHAVADAFRTARDAAASWRRTPASERAAVLVAAAEAIAGQQDDLAALIVREVGKPVTEARQEVARAIAILRYHAGAALDPDGDTYPTLPPADPRSLSMARRRPRGVAGLITPWNFPIAIPLWKAAPALAYGNAVVLKPSPEATAVALRVGELLGRLLPDGVLQVVPGGAATGQALIEASDVVSFTGSVAVGAQVAQAAAARGIPAQCEMGGLNASIVLPDADLESAAKVVAASAMGYAGQKCTATSRVIAVGDPAPLTDALVAAVEALPTGDPADAATVVGPLITAAARDRSVDAAAEARADGARVLAGGSALDGPGLFASPTLVDGLAPSARLAQEEVFGPIATILPAETPERAAELSNAVRYGLVTSVFTRDLDRALELVDRLDTGMIRVNQPTAGVDFHAPFGGEKGSSYGPREQGKHAREIYTAVHTIGIGPAGGG